MTERLTVAINAQVGGNTGGRGQFVESLLRGLAELDGEEEYVVVTNPEYADWPADIVSDNMEVVSRPWEGGSERLKSLLRPIVPLVRPVALPLLQKYRSTRGYSVPESDGFYESLGADLIHFPYRDWTRCDLPMVYNLGDLQHRHFPEFFDQRVIDRREVQNPQGCAEARAVVTASQFVKQDIVEQYGIDPDKIYNIMRAAPSEYYGDGDRPNVRDRFDLDGEFILYPSKKWPHKNHERLFEALARIKEEHGEELTLVCTGSNEPKEVFGKINSRARQLGVDDRIRFLGFVAENELLELYREAAFVVFPTLFEGQGFPLVEAFEAGTPVVCSNIPPLVEYGDDAALFFDPESVAEMADAIHRMATDADLRATYSERSTARGKLLDWKQTAEAYRAVYRRVGGKQLTGRDKALLANSGLPEAVGSSLE